MNTLTHPSRRRGRLTRRAGGNLGLLPASNGPVPTSNGAESLGGDLQEIARLFLGLSPAMRAAAIIEMRRAISRVEDRAWTEG